jgi:hypothetical protein
MRLRFQLIKLGIETSGVERGAEGNREQ